MNKKVAFYHNAFPYGGGERITIDIANYIYDKGYEVYVITSNLNPHTSNHIKAVEVTKQIPHTEQNTTNFIIQFIKENHIDIFITLELNTQFLYEVKKRTQCKIIYALHNVPLWEAIDRYYKRKEKSRHSIWKSLKWYTLTNLDYHLFKKCDKKYIAIYKQMYQNVDALTVLCDAYKKQLATYFEDDKRIHVITNPEYPRLNPNLDKKKQIIYSGRLLYSHKRVDRLLTIWKKIYEKIPDWELVIVGDGPERNNLERLAKKWDLERIYFIGYTPHVDNYYKDASILCLTSTFEEWPLCLTEAQANGVIPISFNCCAGIEAILGPNKVNGILVPDGDINAFAKELIELINNPQLMEEIRKNVLKKVLTYSPELVGEKWLNLFNTLLENSNN